MQLMIANFALASFMVGLTVTIHFGGLLVLMRTLRAGGHLSRAEGSAVKAAWRKSPPFVV